MTTELSAIEQSIVKNMMLSKSHKQIASLLDKPVEIIADVINKITIDTGIKTFQMKMDSVRLLKKAVKRPHFNKGRTDSLKDQARKTREERQMIEHQRANEKRLMNSQYKTRSIDYSQKTMIRIDKKTFIYADRGKEEETKNKYLKLHPQK